MVPGKPRRSQGSQPSIQLQLLPHNLGGLNQPPCYRSAIQKNTHRTTHCSFHGVPRSRPLSDPIPTCPASYLECQQLWWQKPPIPVFISVPQPSTTLTGKHSAHLLTRVREGKSDERDGRKQGLVATLQLLNSNVSLCQQHCFRTSS